MYYWGQIPIQDNADVCCNDEEGGNRGRERDALIAYAEDNDDSSVSSMKKVTGALHSMTT